ncbi:MAG: tRNA (N6-isopentenyl adenosine(37)-C2)-methylthiotransferase MiaB, partial [Chloroflexota bacterium]
LTLRLQFNSILRTMSSYYVWTIGCQMNKAETNRIARCLSSLGYEQAQVQREADVVVVNSCVVRQHAEDKVKSYLGYLRKARQTGSRSRVAVTGCFVPEETAKLYRLYPVVDLFFSPGDYPAFLAWLGAAGLSSAYGSCGAGSRAVVSREFIPIVQGCNNFCTYCIVPYRRGREKSRQPEDILAEAVGLVGRGAKEIVLLGQNVNSYGHDLKDGTHMADLLRQLHELEDLRRIRFLTNHPKDMSISLIEAVSSLSKVCRHICLPVQSGSDAVLRAMNRGYSAADYRRLVAVIRDHVSDVALSTDVIVGFPGETDSDFCQTLGLLEDVAFDMVHAAAYSPRSGTRAASLPDDVPLPVKRRRLEEVESVQAGIAADINRRLEGSQVEVLVEGRKNGKWFGRSGSDKLVFFASPGQWQGRLVKVSVGATSAWALQGEVVAG